MQLKGELPGHLCAKLAATAAAGGRRRTKGEGRPHGAARGAADVKLGEEGGSDAAEDPDLSLSVTALGGSDAAEDPDISLSVTALGGSDTAEDPDISPSVSLGGSDTAEDPDISPRVTALLGRLPRAPEEVCAIQQYTWQQQWLA